MKKIFSSKLFWITIILIVVAGYFFVFEQTFLPKLKKQRELVKKVVPAEKEDITKFVIIHTTETIVCEKVDKFWVMKSPIETKCDNDAVDSIISLVTTTDIEDKFEDITDSDCCLINPKSRVEFTEQKKNKTVVHKLNFGDFNPTVAFVYVRKEDVKPIILATKYVFDEANKRVFNLRDKTIIDFVLGEVKKIKWVKNNDSAVIESDANRDWWMTAEPEGKVKISKNNIEDFLFKTKNMKVQEFVCENAKQKDYNKYGFNHAAGEIGLWIGKNELMQKLTFAEQKNIDYLYVKKNGVDQIFKTDTQSFGMIPNSPNDWANRSVIEFNEFEIKRVEVKTDIKTVLAEKTTTVWHIIAPKDKVEVHIDDIINRLRGLVYLSIITENTERLNNFGLDKPLITITLWKDKKEKVDTIFFSKLDAK